MSICVVLWNALGVNLSLFLGYENFLSAKIDSRWFPSLWQHLNGWNAFREYIRERNTLLFS